MHYFHVKGPGLESAYGRVRYVRQSEVHSAFIQDVDMIESPAKDVIRGNQMLSQDVYRGITSTA